MLKKNIDHYANFRMYDPTWDSHWLKFLKLYVAGIKLYSSSTTIIESDVRDLLITIYC